MDMGTISELKDAGTKQRVYDVLVFGAFTSLSDAWKRNPDPKQVSWRKLDRIVVIEALGYGSVEACQRASDEMRSQLTLLTVCGETCCVKQDVIDELRVILGR